MPLPPSSHRLDNSVARLRASRGWSQVELARRAGMSRAEVSAIETGRVSPSTALALAISRALELPVEGVFRLVTRAAGAPVWAEPPPRDPCPFWSASVGVRTVLYRWEDSALGAVPPDGVAPGEPARAKAADSLPTLVLAGCDPSVRLLESSLTGCGGPRLIALTRSSRRALELLRTGVVHAAGIHLGSSGGRANATAALKALGPGYRLLRVARWEEGVVLGRAITHRTAKAAARARLRWVAREPGAGARACLERLLGPARSRAAARRPTARDHRAVAEAVRAGFADAGVCIRLCAEQAGLSFLPAEREDYDLCYPASLEGDPRIAALLQAVRSTPYRRALAAIGYGTEHTGEVQDVA